MTAASLRVAVERVWLMVASWWNFRRVALISFAFFLLAVLLVFLKIHSTQLSYDLAEKEARYNTARDEFRVLQSQVLRMKTPEALVAKSPSMNLDYFVFAEHAETPKTKPVLVTTQQTRSSPVATNRSRRSGRR